MGNNQTSFGAWVKVESTLSDRNMIFNKMSGGGNQGYRLAIETNKKVRCQIQADSAVTLESTYGITPNEWHHIICDYNTSHMRLFIDGIENNTAIQTGNIVDYPNEFFIGGRTSIDDLFNGSIDDIRIYNRSLSVEQIYKIYSNQTNVLVSDETDFYDNITCEVTPTEGIEDGNTSTSNSALIIENTLVDMDFSSGIGDIIFTPNASNATAVTPLNQTFTKGLFNVTSTDAYDNNFGMCINYSYYTIERIISAFSDNTNWTVFDEDSVNDTYNWTETCMRFSTIIPTDVTPVQQYYVGQVYYQFNLTRAYEFNNETNVTAYNWTSDCSLENYVEFDYGYSPNLIGFTHFEVSYYPIRNRTDTIKLSIIDSTTSVNSTTNYLNVSNWTTLSVDYTSLNASDIQDIRIYVSNQSNGDGLFYLDNLRVYNTSSYSSQLTIKAGCSSNYSTAKTLLDYPTYTNLCTIESNTNQMIWMWQDYNYPTSAIAYDIWYRS